MQCGKSSDATCAPDEAGEHDGTAWKDTTTTRTRLALASYTADDYTAFSPKMSQRPQVRTCQHDAGGGHLGHFAELLAPGGGTVLECVGLIHHLAGGGTTWRGNNQDGDNSEKEVGKEGRWQEGMNYS